MFEVGDTIRYTCVIGVCTLIYEGPVTELHEWKSMDKEPYTFFEVTIDDIGIFEMGHPGDDESWEIVE